ncbi:hypothetical protein ACFQHO_36965 [Actinomadura yumaensis]|uniref:hypothetical protein n=1 Tax=Actinomadura yumaensis TaxID=111807 RepID=UPI00362115F8
MTFLVALSSIVVMDRDLTDEDAYESVRAGQWRAGLSRRGLLRLSAGAAGAGLGAGLGAAFTGAARAAGVPRPRACPARSSPHPPPGS